jgi:hypothetical protein
MGITISIFHGPYGEPRPHTHQWRSNNIDVTTIGSRVPEYIIAGWQCIHCGYEVGDLDEVTYATFIDAALDELEER